jgi:hypothetical protein
LDIINLLILFALGSITGFINVMAGGGSALTLPFLIFLGLDAPTANGTNRVAILALTFSAIRSMHKENHSNFKLSLKLALLTLPGAVIGAILVQSIDMSSFKEILAYVMIGIIAMIILPKKYKDNLIGYLNGKNWLLYPIMIGIGFYGGFIQLGVGFLLMLTLEALLAENLVKVNMHKVFIVFFYTIPSLTIFFIEENVNLVFGLVLAAGMSLGAWFSAKLAIRKGDKIVRIFLILSIFLISLKLLEVY